MINALIKGPGNHGVLRKIQWPRGCWGGICPPEVNQAMRKKRNRGMKCVPVRAG